MKSEDSQERNDKEMGEIKFLKLCLKKEFDSICQWTMPFITSKWAGCAATIELSIIMICYNNIISYSYAVKRHLLPVLEGLTCGYWAEMCFSHGL